MTRKIGVLLVALAACGDNDRLAGAVTGDSPVAKCPHDEGKAHAYSGFELEPSLAIDPQDDQHMVAAWQQDRWTNGGAVALAAATTRDGGAHWTRSVLPFSTCTGGTYDRTSDPWVAISPDGTAYAVGIAFDSATARSAMVATRTTDGRTWEPPTELVADNSADVFNDKDSITADPRTPGRLYATWDRLTGLTTPDKAPFSSGPTWLARATNGTWEPARPIYDPGADAQTIGNVIAALPDGTLVDAFLVLTMLSKKTTTTDIAVIRSTDGGDTWSAPIHVSAATAFGAAAPDGVPVRTGAGLPQIAADGANVYVAWEDSLALDHDAIAFSASHDGGLTWSAPVAINGATDVPAFTPQIAAGGGAVAVTYYDFRDPHGLTTAWMTTSADGGATWSDDAIVAPFQLAPARVGNFYFLGDYEGLVPGPRGFIPFVTIAFAANDPTDIVIRP